MQRLRPLASRALAPSIVALAALLPLAVHWASGRTLAWLDTQTLYAPQRWLVDEALRAFRLPLWNPYVGTGMPFFAEAMHGVLHPISVAVAWLGTGRSADLLIGGYVVAAALGAAWLARELGASWAAASLAALTYALSGYVLSMAGNLVFLAGAGSLPFCVGGLRRAGAGADAGGVLAGALGAAVLALSGDAQALMIGGPLGVALAWGAGGWRGAARAAGVGLLGLLLASVQLVPSAVHVPRTTRSVPTCEGVELNWALEVSRLPELVLPGLFQNVVPSFDPVYAAVVGPGRWPVGVDAVPFAASIFVGLLPLALAVVGGSRGRTGALLAGCAALLAWIAMGTTLGAHAVLRHVPVWNSFRYMEKLVAPLTLVIALLAALGADAACEDARAARRAMIAGLALGAIAVLGGAWVAATIPPDAAAQLLARVGRGAWQMVPAALFLLAWAALHRRLGLRSRGALLALAAWGGAVAATPAALRPGDPAARLRAPLPRLDAPPPGARIATPYWNPPAFTAAGMATIDEDGIHGAAVGLPAYNVRERLDSVGEYTGMVPARLLRLEMAFGKRWEWAARRFAVTHVVTDGPQTAEQAARHVLAVEGATRLRPPSAGVDAWATPHLAWARFPLTIHAVEDEATGLAATRASIEGAEDAAIVETRDPLAVAPGRVLGVARGTEEVRIEAEAVADATLVVADAWWPGWEASIDGRPVPIHLADSLVRAVPWPSGRHVLELRYRPPEVRAGPLLSATGALALAAWLAVARLRRRRPSCSRER